VGIKEQLAQGLLPVGSNRRQRAIDAARTVGIVSPPKLTDYERWVERVEPHLWSNVVSPSESITFVVDISCTPQTQTADITSTLVSLVDQSWPHWTAHIQLNAASAEVRHVATAALDHDARFSFGPVPATGARFALSLTAGDTLAPRALNELVVAVNTAETDGLAIDAILADADSCVVSTRRREFPLLVPPPHVDLLEQFDVGSAFLVRATSSNASGTLRPLTELVADGAIAHVPRILLHRKRVQPPQRNLLPTVAGGDPQNGTRAYYKPPADGVVNLVIRNPLAGEAGARHRARVMTSPGSITIRHIEVDASNAVDLAKLNDSKSFTVIIDGAAWPTEQNWLDDLIGVCARDHVLAVAPLIVAPSGVAFDCGVDIVEAGRLDPTLKARSGRLDLPPYELARVTPVASLSGRVMVIRTADLHVIGAHTSLSALTSRRLFDYAAEVKRSPVIWAHQRWTVEGSLADIGPLTPAAAAWQSGRFTDWFDADVIPHQPVAGRMGEGVW
jgi:hypothetical protein